MIESVLLARYLNVARPILEGQGAVVFKHSDLSKGMPDVSVTLWGKTSWQEFKMGNGQRVNMRGRAVQWVRMQQLATAGIAWYVIYEKIKDVKSVAFVRPSDMDQHGRYFAITLRHEGWDHESVARFVLNLHTCP